MSSNKNMFNIFGFWRCELSTSYHQRYTIPKQLLALILVPPFTDLSKEPDIGGGRRDIAPKRSLWLLLNHD